MMLAAAVALFWVAIGLAVLAGVTALLIWLLDRRDASDLAHAARINAWIEAEREARRQTTNREIGGDR